MLLYLPAPVKEHMIPPKPGLRFLIAFGCCLLTGCATRTTPASFRSSTDLSEFEGVYENRGTMVSGVSGQSGAPSFWYMLTDAPARYQKDPEYHGDSRIKLMIEPSGQVEVKRLAPSGDLLDTHTLHVNHKHAGLHMNDRWWFLVIGFSHRCISVYLSLEGDCILVDDMSGASLFTGYHHHRNYLFKRTQH